MHPDQQYITALLNNDAPLIEEVYVKYAGKIKWMVIKNNGDANDAADIFQEALVDIFHKASERDFILTCPFECFLYIICKNKWITELGKRKRQKVLFVDSIEFTDKGNNFQQFAERTRQQERKALLEEKIAELCEGHRNLLQLSWSGRKMNEVAELLNVTYGYARKKKSECMAKLKRMVQCSPKFDNLK
jgi:RNA polymerase sigma factor (sigma-70 family)